MSEPLLSVAEWRAQAGQGEAPLRARLHVEITARHAKTTREGKPYYDLEFSDASGRDLLRIWNNAPFFLDCGELQARDWVELAGEFVPKPGYGLEPRALAVRPLSASEVEAALAGTADRAGRLEADFALLQGTLGSLSDPRLRALCLLFLDRHGPRFRRASAARMNHHARRGGLLEHTTQMMRAAVALCGVYPHLRRDLLLAGVLFHDCGKMWENPTPERSTSIEVTTTGELLGHIMIGCELLNKLWSELRDGPSFQAWEGLQPRSEDVRQHLLHLIVSHHGELAFGSPVLPKTPEAFALHYIDSLDARLEMLTGAYAQAPQVAPGVFERVRPLGSNLIRPLGQFDGPAE
ncbi:MAG: HD domain-containing protein [Verrucomicrobia bacterium]|nr:HD domain-containing protein [Verrucomicrobiota bacterium]